MIIANSALRASLAIHHLTSNTHSWNKLLIINFGDKTTFLLACENSHLSSLPNDVKSVRNLVMSSDWSTNQLYFFSYCLRIADNRQKATKVKCKRDESVPKQSLEEAFEFCSSSFPEEHCKNLFNHWFTSSVWNFCRWGADVSSGKTFLAARKQERWLFSLAEPLNFGYHSPSARKGGTV